MFIIEKQEFNITVDKNDLTVSVITNPLKLELGSYGLQGPTGAAGSGGGTAEFRSSFTLANLNVNHVLPVTHNLNLYPANVTILDNNNLPTLPDSWYPTSLNTIAVDLTAYGNFNGTWTIIIQS